MTSSAADIFAALKADHKKQRELLRQLEQTSGKSQERRERFVEFTYEAKGHAAAEEQALYSAILAKTKTTAKGRHSVAEHKEMEDMLNALAATDMASSAWLPRFRSLKEKYLHHLEEEEKKIFPAANRVLTDTDVIHMHNVFKARKPIEKGKAKVTPEKEAEE